MHKDFQKQKLPFPFDCTLENINTPKAFRRKMRSGILNLLKGHQEPKLMSITNAVKEFKVDDF
jgi:hypothetical protein